MQNKLTALITALEALDHDTPDQELGNTISVLKIIAADPQKKAQVENDDNRISGYILSIIAIHPEIMEHPHNQALKELSSHLNPTYIANVPNFIWDRLLETSITNKLVPKNRLGSSK